MMAEAETLLRKKPGTTGEGRLDNSSSSSMGRATSLTTEGQQQEEKQQEEQKLEEQQEEEEKRFPAHEACWEGRVEELQHMLHLDDPDYMEDPRHLEQALLQEGSVPVCLNFLGHDGSHQHCPKEEGTLAVLAVRKRRFECANLLLCGLLFLKIQRAAWCDKGCPKWAEPGSRHLCKLLLYVGLKHCADFASLFLETLVSECTAFLTLVAACVLGDAELAATVTDTQDQAYWNKVNKAIQCQALSHCCRFGDNFSETAATLGACIGGKAACVALVRKLFPLSGHILPDECRQILKRSVWSWEPEEIVRCLVHCPKGLTGLDDLIFFKELTETVVQPQKCLEADRVRSKAESSENFANDLLQAVQVASKMTLVNDASQARILGILFRIMLWFSSVDPKSKAAELLNGLASHALYLQSLNGVLCGDFSERLVARCKAEKRGAVLSTLFQFWVATRSLYKPPAPSCFFCRQPRIFVLRELILERGMEALETLAQYWTTQRPSHFFEVASHNGQPLSCFENMCTVCRNKIVSLKFICAGYRTTSVDPEGKLESIFQPKVQSLTQLSLLAVLRKMDQERKLFLDFGLPGGMGKLFMVHDFLEEWGCGRETKE